MGRMLPGRKEFSGPFENWSPIDGVSDPDYIGFNAMPTRKIQIGQVWKKDGTTDSYLVTKVYTEALATFAVLRKAGAEGEAPLRIKVGNAGAAQTLPGFLYTQESEDF